MLSVATRLRGPQQVLRLLEITASVSASPFLSTVWLFRALALRVIADEVGARCRSVTLLARACALDAERDTTSRPRFPRLLLPRKTLLRRWLEIRLLLWLQLRVQC